VDANLIGTSGKIEGALTADKKGRKKKKKKKRAMKPHLQDTCQRAKIAGEMDSSLYQTTEKGLTSK